MKGALRKNPDRARARENEPQPEGNIGPPPADFLKPGMDGPLHLAIWNELIAQTPVGVLTSADRFHVESTVRLFARDRRGVAKTAEKALLNKMLGQMGLNPADRSRVAASKRKPGSDKDDWEDIRDSGRKARTG